MLPCYLSWWNSSKLVLKKNWVQMFDSVESFGWNSGDTFGRGFFTTLCLRGIQDEKRRDRGELETMARQVLF